jgi:hypothetical protein
MANGSQWRLLRGRVRRHRHWILAEAASPLRLTRHRAEFRCTPALESVIIRPTQAFDPGRSGQEHGQKGEGK